MSDTTTQDPTKLAAEYLELKASIAELENRAKLVKDSLSGLLPYAEGFKAAYGPAFVLWAKGRRVEKVDVKAARKELVLAGVTPEIIEAAFAKATTVTIGSPTLRISGSEEEGE